MTEALCTKTSLVVMGPNGIVALTPDLAVISGSCIAITDGDWDSLKTDDVFMNRDLGVAMFGRGVRGEGAPEDLVACFAEFLQEYPPAVLYGLTTHRCEATRRTLGSGAWKAWNKRIYRLTMQHITYVNIKGTVLKITRERGQVFFTVVLTGYKNIGSVLYSTPGVQHPECFEAIWDTPKTLKKHPQRLLDYAIDANCRQFKFLSRFEVLPWPKDMKPIPYREDRVAAPKTQRVVADSLGWMTQQNSYPSWERQLVIANEATA